ncbi:Hypothetical Protein FCC1311_103882 [Hondaea fermentalgiana]|uniref:Uncharacterized protein n=1 Tax=Hondaea fermentalgiana TaxID=2315210 RepID=A0A2R5H1E6_9STRA|nr:Hypothetical Protein FCC1311_103882 [Hondaea fermentalgiana]|eukprot:GBG34164.1 Hypothetical Protein FCC1311_103882 [Hondaea fermentalgiana]
MQGAGAGAGAWSTERALRTLRGALAADAGVRRSAEAALAQALAEPRHDETSALAALLALVLERARAAQAGPEALLAAVTLRRAVRPGDADQVLARLVNGGALGCRDARARAANAALVSHLALSGTEPEIAAKVDGLVALGSSPEASAETRKGCLKCAKLIAIQSKSVDGKKLALPQRLSPLFKTALASSSCDDAAAAAAASLTISAIARTMTLLANTALMHSNTELPAWWLSTMVRCASHPDVQLFARCNALRLVHSVWKQRRSIRQNASLREDASSLATNTLSAVSSGGLNEQKDETVNYDSDDGEPRGPIAAAAVACEILRDVVEELIDETRQDVDVGPLVELGLRASRLRTDIRVLFTEDPNEFVAVHEDETALNEPRHAAVGLLESLYEFAPKPVTAKLTSIRMEHASELDVEALLWCTGCLLPTLEESYDGAHSLCAAELMRSLDLWCEALAAQMHLDPLLHARLLWCIWLRMRRPDASSTPAERALVLRSMAEAAITSGGLLPGVGLHAAQAFSQILRRERALMDGRGGVQAFVGLVGILSSSSPDTAHIAIQAIEVALDTANGVPVGAPCQDLVRYIIRLWSLGIRNDPMLSQTCGRILLHVSRRVTDLLQQVSEASPSLAGQICRADVDCRLHAQALSLFDLLHAAPPPPLPPSASALGSNTMQNATEDRFLCMAECLRVVARVRPAEVASRLVWLREQGADDLPAYSAAVVCCLRAARMSSMPGLLANLGKDVVRFPCSKEVLLEVALGSMAVGDVAWLLQLQTLQSPADLVAFVIASAGRADSPVGIVLGAFLCLCAQHAPQVWTDASVKPFLRECLTWSATSSEPDVEDNDDLWGFALPAELDGADDEVKNEDTLLDAFDGNAQDYQLALATAKALISRLAG